MRRRKKYQAPAPWDNPDRIDTRPGPPRTLLSNVTKPVKVTYNGKVVEVGTFDYIQHLYQHAPGPKGLRSLTMDIGGEPHVMYNLSREWYPMTHERCHWIELNDRQTRITRRLAFEDAKRVGFATDTPNGPRWAIPLSAYTEYVKEQG